MGQVTNRITKNRHNAIARAVYFNSTSFPNMVWIWADWVETLLYSLNMAFHKFSTLPAIKTPNPKKDTRTHRKTKLLYFVSSSSNFRTSLSWVDAWIKLGRVLYECEILLTIHFPLSTFVDVYPMMIILFEFLYVCFCVRVWVDWRIVFFSRGKRTLFSEDSLVLALHFFSVFECFSNLWKV